jgi:hypothetical protein
MSCRGVVDCVSVLFDRHSAWVVPLSIYLGLSVVMAMFLARFFRAGSRRRTAREDKRKADDARPKFD